jgi:hypothetical protein
MHFLDRKGREWCFALNLGIAERLLRELEFDLIDPESGWAERLDADAELLVDVMYIIAEPQCDRYGVTPKRFAKLLRHRFAEAHGAFVEAIKEFFPEFKEDAPDPDGDGEGFGWRQVYEYAGYVGVDPRPLTLRALCWMVQGRLELEGRTLWSASGPILLRLHNAHFKPPLKADDVDPFAKTQKVDFKRPRRRSLL